jgi:hypothetical protein
VVSYLRRFASSSEFFPTLTGWANFFRAYGAEKTSRDRCTVACHFGAVLGGSSGNKLAGGYLLIYLTFREYLISSRHCGVLTLTPGAISHSF